MRMNRSIDRLDGLGRSIDGWMNGQTDSLRRVGDALLRDHARTGRRARTCRSPGGRRRTPTCPPVLSGVIEARWLVSREPGGLVHIVRRSIWPSAGLGSMQAHRPRGLDRQGGKANPPQGGGWEGVDAALCPCARRRAVLVPAGAAVAPTPHEHSFAAHPRSPPVMSAMPAEGPTPPFKGFPTPLESSNEIPGVVVCASNRRPNRIGPTIGQSGTGPNPKIDRASACPSLSRTPPG